MATQEQIEALKIDVNVSELVENSEHMQFKTLPLKCRNSYNSIKNSHIS